MPDVLLTARRHVVPVDGEWRVYDDAQLAANRELAGAVLELEAQVAHNPIRFFLPHGGAEKFLSDRDHDIVMLLAPNQVGKSYAGTAFSILRAIPTHPGWEVFARHGVEYHPWEGPKEWLVASYSWDNVEVLWDHYRHLLPRSELGQFAPGWGRGPHEKGRAKNLSFGDGRPKRCRLACGTEFVFACYTQQQIHWEGKRYDGAQFDEQPPHEKFIGYLRGITTRDSAQCCFTLTGHVVEGRPDTGAGGWIKRDLWDGRDTHGRSVSRHQFGVDDVPDAILSRKRKDELLEQWVTVPELNKDRKRLREAKARYWGGWEPGSGLVLDNFDADIHVVPEIPGLRKSRLFKDATRYRGMDHGTDRPTAAVMGAVFPWGDVLLYDEYYEPGRTVPQHAKAIVELCGNKRRLIVPMVAPTDDTADVTWPVYEEEQTGTLFFSSVLDGRSFRMKAPERGIRVGQLYNDCGVYCTPASTLHNKELVPGMKRWFEVDPDRPHLMTQLHRRGVVDDKLYARWLAGRRGDPNHGSRLYILDHLRHTVDEILTWGYKRDKDEPQSGGSVNDHIVGGALKYLLAEDPGYMGDMNGGKETAEEYERDAPRSVVCGY